jgi:hypothetical protein
VPICEAVQRKTGPQIDADLGMWPQKGTRVAKMGNENLAICADFLSLLRLFAAIF